MKKLELIKSNKNIIKMETVIDGGYLFLKLFPKGKLVKIIFSWGDGWDHISASYSNRCLTWEEMCMVRDIFFNEDETVIQYHPTKDNYVNIHPYTLHLWRPQNEKIPVPPKYMV